VNRGHSRIGTALVLAVAALAMVALTATANAADWPSFRGGPTQNMISPEDPGKHPEQIWQSSIGSVRAEPCVIAVGDAVFTVATPPTDFGAQRLYRIDLQNGKTVWSSPPFEATEAQSCPAADESRVYHPHGSSLTARTVAEGKEVWQTSLGGLVGKPALGGGKVYVSAGGKLFALDSTDGSVEWSTPVPPSGRPPLILGDVVVSVSYENFKSLTAFDAVTGEPLWSADGRPWDAIAVGDSIVATPGGSAVVSHDAATGDLAWSYTPPPMTKPSSLVADEGVVYTLAASADHRFQANHLIALDMETGEPRYERKFEMTTSCCGTTAPYPPFVKFGSTLYNQHRYFDPLTGDSPGDASEWTQTIFRDDVCGTDQESSYAKVGEVVVMWKRCGSGSVLVAKRAASLEPPELIRPEDGTLTGSRPNFEWRVEPTPRIGHYELVVDGEVLAEIPEPGESEVVSFTPEEGLSGGTHTWSVKVFDRVGNYLDSQTSSFEVDASPPSPFSLIAPDDEAFRWPRPELDWEASTDTGSGISHYEVILDGEAFVVEADEFVPPFELTEGLHVWSVVAIDRIGNRTQSETRSFTVDNSPPAPFALLEPKKDAVTDARPRFSWEPAVDVGPAGLDHYELYIDGGSRVQLPPGTESYVPSEDLGPGSHAWGVEAVDKVGRTHSVETQYFIVASPPHAALLFDPVWALSGTPVTFDASPSSPPLAGDISGYQWDLDGDGTFELDTGMTPTASHAYLSVGEVTMAVRVLTNLGTEAIASATVSVRPAPPAGPLGVTINNGAQFTNNPNVTVSVVWPEFAATASLSNDGGFRAAGQIPLAADIPWTLESSGSERLPKTVYVRFGGGTAGRETYQDDIILDQQKPKVGKASLTDGTVLDVRAQDATSGVTMMQIAFGEGSVIPWRAFKRRVSWTRRHYRVKVRVRDRAGNVSRWHRAQWKRR